MNIIKKAEYNKELNEKIYELEILLKNTKNLDRNKFKEVFISVMKNSSIPETYYSIGDYRDEAMCIEQIDDSSWTVYHGERGNKYDIRKFNNILDGLIFLIEIFSESEDDYLKKRIEFLVGLSVGNGLDNKEEVKKIRQLTMQDQ